MVLWRLVAAKKEQKKKTNHLFSCIMHDGRSSDSDPEDPGPLPIKGAVRKRPNETDEERLMRIAHTADLTSKGKSTYYERKKKLAETHKRYQLACLKSIAKAHTRHKNKKKALKRTKSEGSLQKGGWATSGLNTQSMLVQLFGEDAARAFSKDARTKAAEPEKIPTALSIERIAQTNRQAEALGASEDSSTPQSTSRSQTSRKLKAIRPQRGSTPLRVTMGSVVEENRLHPLRANHASHAALCPCTCTYTATFPDCFPYPLYPRFSDFQHAYPCTCMQEYLPL